MLIINAKNGQMRAIQHGQYVRFFQKDRELSVNDIKHYQRIIFALTETDRIMKEIDKIEIE